MPRSMKNDNFIDKTFTVMADLILKLLPGVSSEEKKAFAYYRDGMAAQSEGEYAEALENYREALALEQGEEDRSYILYNMGLIYQSNGELDKALDHYHQALELNPRLCSALNNIAVLLHHKGELSLQAGMRKQQRPCSTRLPSTGFGPFALPPTTTSRPKTG